MSTILAIDPGTTRSAWVLYDAEASCVLERGIQDNSYLLEELRYIDDGPDPRPSVAVIEQVASYGMPVGAEVFETVRWSGRFEEALHPTPVVQLTRKTIVVHLCGSARAKDPNVRQVLLDRWGGKAAAIGLKKTPGPLYGLHADLWAALAVAVAYAEGAKNPEPKKP